MNEDLNFAIYIPSYMKKEDTFDHVAQYERELAYKIYKKISDGGLYSIRIVKTGFHPSERDYDIRVEAHLGIGRQILYPVFPTPIDPANYSFWVRLRFLFTGRLPL